MFKLLWWTLPFTVIFIFGITNGQEAEISEEAMDSILAEYNQKLIERCRRVTVSSWNVATDVGNKAKEDEKVRPFFSKSKINQERTILIFNDA